jgi:bifunctional UDP-N-acetylglucosamine pyrophosphorylase/glucosamine-1-phosphate N-acetyltransferase
MNSTIKRNAPSVQAIILAAGQGSRLKTGITKMITPICGQPMVLYPVQLLASLQIPTTVVIGYQKDLVHASIAQAKLNNVSFAEQKEQLGTGHALLAAQTFWTGDTLLVLNGDMPCIDRTTIEKLIAHHTQHNAAITIATSYNTDPENTFGRIVHENGILKIVEKKHFTYSIEQFPYVNVGIYVINRSFVERYAHHIQQNSSTHEFYITDLVALAGEHNLLATSIELPFETCYGVNTFQELAIVEDIKRTQLITYWMNQGVRFIAPHTVHIDHTVILTRGCVIYPGVQLLGNSRIEEFCTIMPHAVVQDSHIDINSLIGAHSVLSDTYIEKNATIAPLSYLSGHKPLANIKHATHTIINS